MNNAAVMLEVDAVLDNLMQVQETVRTAANSYGLSPEQVLRVELVIEEAFLNIAHHAYHDQGGPVSICCDRDDEGLFRIILCDKAHSFEPPAVPLPRPDSIEVREPGGDGLTLIRCLTRSAVWQREDGYNTLTLIFGLDSATPGVMA